MAQFNEMKQEQQNNIGEEVAPHPLISLVFTLVLPHVSDGSDLKNFRLANRLCWDTSREQWRRKMTLRLLWRKDQNQSRDCYHKQDYLINNSIDVAEFLQMLQASAEQGKHCPYQWADQPFSKYRIVNCDLLQAASDGRDKLQDFLTGYGQHIKFLALDHCSISKPTTEGFREAFGGIFLETMVNLEELSIVLGPVKEASGQPPIPNFLGTLQANNAAAIKSASSPKLETIYIQICENADEPIGTQWMGLFHFTPNLKKLVLDSDTYSSVVGALPFPMSEDGKCLQLSSIIFRTEFPYIGVYSYSSLRTYLEVVKPPLRELKLSDCWNADGGWDEILREMLVLCQNSLEVLSLRGQPRQTSNNLCAEDSMSRLFYELNFPKLTKLYLTVEAVISLEAVKNLPNLKVLWIKAGHCVQDLNRRITRASEEEAKGGSRILWEGLKHFHLDYFRCTQNSLRILGGWMPNLKRLELILNKNLVQVVEETWPNLEALIALRGSVLEGEANPILTRAKNLKL